MIFDDSHLFSYYTVVGTVHYQVPYVLNAIHGHMELENCVLVPTQPKNHLSDNHNFF